MDENLQFTASLPIQGSPQVQTLKSPAGTHSDWCCCQCGSTWIGGDPECFFAHIIIARHALTLEGEMLVRAAVHSRSDGMYEK